MTDVREGDASGLLVSLAGLVGFLGLAFAASLGGLLFPPGEWYASLQRPAFAPPNWIFGPVWTVLYILMGLSAWLVWQKTGLRSRALGWWGIQLVLNALWTPLFFGLNWMGVAAIELALLLLAIVLCIREFKIHSQPAAWMMLPYLLWVSFAWVLNIAFWYLNQA